MQLWVEKDLELDDIVLSLDLTLANWDTLNNLSDLSVESVLNS